MQSTTIPRHCVAVHGTFLGGELRKLLRDLGYNLQAIKDTIDHIGVNGTCEGSAVETEDVDAVEGLVVRHTAATEYESAEDWPAWTDRGQWVTEDAVDGPTDFPAHAEPANAPLPPSEAFGGDYEPSYEERVWLSSGGSVDLHRVPETVTIKGLSYELATNAGAYLPSFRLTSPVGKVYDVTETPDGPACDCPDFVYRRDGIDPDGCKHVKALVECGLIHPALPAICGAAPSPDERPIKLRGVRSRVQPDWTDADQYRAHGCV